MSVRGSGGRAVTAWPESRFRRARIDPRRRLPRFGCGAGRRCRRARLPHRSPRRGAVRVLGGDGGAPSSRGGSRPSWRSCRERCRRPRGRRAALVIPLGVVHGRPGCGWPSIRSTPLPQRALAPCVPGLHVAEVEGHHDPDHIDAERAIVGEERPAWARRPRVAAMPGARAGTCVQRSVPSRCRNLSTVLRSRPGAAQTRRPVLIE